MTTNSAWRIGIVAALATTVASLSAGLIGSAIGQPAASSGSSTCCVAVISVSKILQGLDERSDKESDLAKDGKVREDKVNALGQQAQAALGELDVLPVGTAAWKDKREEAMRLDAQFRLEKEIAERVLGEQQKTMQLALFNKIMESVKAYADREGYKLVLTNDSGDRVAAEMPDQQFMAALTGRRVAYASDEIDITDEVILAMNNEYKAP